MSSVPLAWDPRVWRRAAGPVRLAMERPESRLVRDAEEADLVVVLAINEDSVPGVNSLTADQLRWLWNNAEYFRLVEVGDEIAGFLICLMPDAPYWSANLRWFNENFEDFLYIDRIAVADQFQGRGIATELYVDAARRARPGIRALVCEVNSHPPNPASMRFHERLGFGRVGSQDHGSTRVRYLLRALPLPDA